LMDTRACAADFVRSGYQSGRGQRRTQSVLAQLDYIVRVGECGRLHSSVTLVGGKGGKGGVTERILGD